VPVSGAYGNATAPAFARSAAALSKASGEERATEGRRDASVRFATVSKLP